MQHRKVDERVQIEVDKIMADLFYIQMLFVVMAVMAQLFLERSFISFLPAIVGGGGAVLFFLVRYVWAGLLLNRATDERIEAYKLRTKSIGYSIAFFAHLFGGFVLNFFFSVNTVFIFFCWFIPALILTVKVVIKGVGNFIVVIGEKECGIYL